MEQLLIYGLIIVLLFAVINGTYISFFGIRLMDKCFSQSLGWKSEMLGPFDGFARMHKYIFLYVIGVERTQVGIYMKVWMYVTGFSLVVYWSTFIYGVVLVCW